jgi:hypothetical protein
MGYIRSEMQCKITACNLTGQSPEYGIFHAVPHGGRNGIAGKRHAGDGEFGD